MAKYAYKTVIVVETGDWFERPTINDLILLIEEKRYDAVEFVEASDGDIIMTLKETARG